MRNLLHPILMPGFIFNGICSTLASIKIEPKLALRMPEAAATGAFTPIFNVRSAAIMTCMKSIALAAYCNLLMQAGRNS